MDPARAIVFSVVAGLALAGCPDANPPRDGAPSDALDAALDAAAPDEGIDAPDAAPPPPPWPHELPPARATGEPRGLRPARVIIHAHSVHSHDACDGNPYVDGGVNEPCLQSFRAAACRTRLDAVFLTEHAGLMADGAFERVMQLRPGDERVEESGALVGYRFACPDGHRVLVLPGAENELMPLALTRHPDPVGGSLHAAYHADDPAGVARFRAAGALVAVPHVEQRELAHLVALGPDAIEVYNIHSNLDPRIAGPHLMFDVGAVLLDVTRFARPEARLEPDLVFLALFGENGNDLRKWGAYLADRGAGRAVTGFAASDAHENALPMRMPDGERGDSYRRIFRFYSNVLFTEGEPTRASLLAAIRAGRGYVMFEAFGTPAGFDFTAGVPGGAAREMGARVPLAEAPVLRAATPAVHALEAALPRPRVRTRILRADAAAGWVEVAAGEGTSVEFAPTARGAYRAEVRIVPEHARPYLPRMERIVREVPWVYSNAIYVE